jgi:hypothetical protein
MAVPNVIANTVEVRCMFSNGGELAFNVLGFRKTGTQAVDQTLANTVGTAIKGAWTSHMAPVSATTCSLLRVGTRDLTQAHLPEFLDTGAAAPGTDVGDPLPSKVAFVITLRTALAGKSFRGRIYIPGATETSNTTGGVASAAYQAAALAYVQQIQTAMNAAGLQLAINSHAAERQTIVVTTFHNDGTTTVRTKSNETAKTGQSNVVIAIESLNSAWESQRRRGNGRGAGAALALAQGRVTRFLGS